MKLVKLYSNQAGFKNIQFNPNVNVIMGILSDTKTTSLKESKKNMHNLGKSFLIDLLDFMLLKEASKDSFWIKNLERFKSYAFFLEIELNSGNFLTIRRYVIESNASISFSLNSSSTYDFEAPSSWQKKEMLIDEAKKTLNSYLNFDIVPEYDYRKSLPYFMRRQADYHEVFLLEKDKQGQHVNWKPMVFELLGFNSNYPKQKYDYEKSLEDLKKKQAAFKDYFSGDISRDSLKGQILVLQKDKEILSKQIETVNFFTQDRKDIEHLVKKIDTQINELNTMEYYNDSEINQINNSIFHQQTKFDIDEVEAIYNQINIFFPDNLKKSYLELKQFNETLTSERNKYLKIRLDKLKVDAGIIQSKLKELNDEKSQLLAPLTNKDSFAKIREYQQKMLVYERKIAEKEAQIKIFDQLDSIKNEIEHQKLKIRQMALSINESIKKSTETYNKIREFYQDFVMEILGSPAVLSISTNKQDNVEFNINYQNEQRLDTQEDKGTSYKKMLCIAFEITLMCIYAQKSFFRFAYHDGIFETFDNRIKYRLIEKLRFLSKVHNIQFIVSAIKDDIPAEANFLQKGEIILTLNDNPDGTGKLFGFNF